MHSDSVGEHELERRAEAFAAVPLPLFLIGRDRQVLGQNQAGDRFRSQRELSESGGGPCHQLLYGRDSACSFCPFTTAEYQEEHALVAGPGSNTRAYQLSFAPLAGHDGNVLVEMIQDVTVRRREEDRRIRMERLAAMGTMVSGVAHELNNPLTGMELNLQTLSANLDTMEVAEVSRRLTMIRKDLNRASRIVNDVLGFARAGPLRLQRADMRQIVERARSNVQRLYAALAREVSWDIQSEGDTIFLFNPEKMERVFINLFRNSLQAFDYRAGSIRVHIAQAETGSRIAIEDDAGGIAPKVLERIFEPFAPGSGQSRGVGLGLAICHNIVTEHRGSIQAHSNGGGTRFVINLPAVLSSDA